MTPKLKPPGTKHLKLKCDVLLSTSAFSFNLRRYSVLHVNDLRELHSAVDALLAGAHTPPIFSST